jgi:hypothetical protein
MWTLTIRDVDGEVLGVVLLEPKSFKTGSTGLFGARKITVGDERFQVQAQAVLIGSKPSESAAPGAEVA